MCAWTLHLRLCERHVCHSTRNDVFHASTQQLPFQHLDTNHSFKFFCELLEEGSLEQKDVVKASPLNGGRFDTVVVLTTDTAGTVGLEGNLVFYGPVQFMIH